MASVFNIPDADILPEFHIFQQIAEVHTGKMDNGNISWRRRRRRTVRASGSYVWEAGGTGGAARVDRVEVMARIGDGAAVLPVDMVGFRRASRAWMSGGVSHCLTRHAFTTPARDAHVGDGEQGIARLHSRLDQSHNLAIQRTRF